MTISHAHIAIWLLYNIFNNKTIPINVYHISTILKIPKQIKKFQYIVLIQFLSKVNKVNKVNNDYMWFESLKKVYRKLFNAFLKMHTWGSIDTNISRNH